MSWFIKEGKLSREDVLELTPSSRRRGAKKNLRQTGKGFASAAGYNPRP